MLCVAAGAERAINYREEDFVEVVKAATDGGVNAVLDMVGGDDIQRNMKALAPEGRLIFIAFLHGSRAEVDFTPVMLKRLTLTGSTLRARELAFKATLAARLEAHVWPLLEARTMRPHVHRTYRLSEAGDAHRLMEAGGQDSIAHIPEALELDYNGPRTGSINATPSAGDYFNMRKLSIFGGSNEIQRNIIAQLVLGL